MADLQAHVPQTIKDRLGDRFAPGGLLIGKQEEKIDIGARRHQPAAISAGGNDRHALGFRPVAGLIEMLADQIEQDADDLVLHEAEPFGAKPALPLLQ